MIKHPYFARRTAILLAALLFLVVSVAAQPEPRQEKLLNGLKILLLTDAKAPNVSLKLRIHSGSAFDPQGKEGVMKLLSENIFPNAEAREFFRDDLGGSLDIRSNYDFIEIDASSKPSEMLNMLETVATAISNPQIDKETTQRLKQEQIARVKSLESNPAYVADIAAAKQLLGTFPYGRPQNGTAESIQRIDFADLIDAKQRFLTSDNATIAISGNFDSNLAYRALRRYFGSWIKSDKRTPSTFRQPDSPPLAMKVLDSPVAFTSEFRMVRRGFARNEADYYPSLVVEQILSQRFKSGNPASFVKQEFHILPGTFTIGSSSVLQPVEKEGANVVKPNSDDDWDKYLEQPITQNEFEAALRQVTEQVNRRDASEALLDVDTYGLGSVKADRDKARSVTFADAQRALERIKKEPAVYVNVFSREKKTADAVRQN